MRITRAASSVDPGTYQPLDSDLTAIAALSTTSFGRNLLALADAAAGRTALGLGTAATSASGDFQPVDSDLTAIAALTTTSYGRAFLALADGAALRAVLGTGTPSSSNFLRGDGSWAAAGGAVVEGRFKASDNTVHYSVPGFEGINTNGTVARTAATLYYEPFIVDTPITIDQLCIRVQAAGAGSTTARLGIYNADTDWRPTTLVMETAAFAVDSTGIKAATVSQALPVGRYLFAYISDGAPTIYVVTGTVGRLAPLWAPSGNQDRVHEWKATQTYGALPASPPTPTVNNGNGVGFHHGVFVRVSVP